MSISKSFHSSSSSIHDLGFEQRTMELFRYQAQSNAVYAKYISALGTKLDEVTTLAEIPFLPIVFFKEHVVKTSSWEPNVVFESSGTTGMQTSKHHINDVQSYLDNADSIFQTSYSNLQDYHFLALLPSYLERNNSSLVYMMDHFIKESRSPYSGFYLNNQAELVGVLNRLKNDSSRKTILVGVTFALLDLIEQYQLDFPDLIVMETGGMKGRRKEMIRSEVHELLKEGFSVNNIHSEYGMTELLSQAYAKENGVFRENDQLKILVRDINDPFTYLQTGRAGGINVIDLANKDSCAFIETQDLGRKLPNGSFEVLGRFDNSDIRGCSLMTA